MSSWEDIAQQLASGGTLTYEQSRLVMSAVMTGSLNEMQLASFLSFLALRGVAVPELLGLADEMRSFALPIDLPTDVVDIVGTGGDRANTANISTMSAVVVAGMGLPVVKHGNRASTSACGSADVLEALGVNLDLEVPRIVEVFNATGIAFLFANKFHPSMRYAAKVRRELTFPTVFNVLGPLTNPAKPQISVVGVAKESAAPLVAGVFAERGTSAYVFRGTELGLDEVTTVEPVQVFEVRNGQVAETIIDPAEILGVPRATLADLKGGSPTLNAQIARSVFAGKASPVADAVTLNSALAVLAADPQVNGSLESRLALAAARVGDTLSSGQATDLLERWVAATNA